VFLIQALQKSRMLLHAQGGIPLRKLTVKLL
jgi:hypothetical protein